MLTLFSKLLCGVKRPASKMLSSAFKQPSTASSKQPSAYTKTQICTATIFVLIPLPWRLFPPQNSTFADLCSADARAWSNAILPTRKVQMRTIRQDKICKVLVRVSIIICAMVLLTESMGNWRPRLGAARDMAGSCSYDSGWMMGVMGVETSGHVITAGNWNIKCIFLTKWPGIWARFARTVPVSLPPLIIPARNAANLINLPRMYGPWRRHSIVALQDLYIPLQSSSRVISRTAFTVRAI